MRIIEVTASCSRKYGLPNYSSIDIFVALKASIEKRENPQKAAECLIRKCVHLAESEGKKKLAETQPEKGTTVKP